MCINWIWLGLEIKKVRVLLPMSLTQGISKFLLKTNCLVSSTLTSKLGVACKPSKQLSSEKNSKHFDKYKFDLLAFSKNYRD